MATDSPRLRLGTRASPLARWQADWVSARLQEHGIAVKMVLITTQGDQQQSGPIGAIGTQGVFTKEIQRALLDRRIDLAVHSLKDLPTADSPGLWLAAVPDREAPGDALISRDGQPFASLAKDARIGTGSPRRRSQLWHARPDLEMLDVRGNVDTRLRKLDEGQFEAIVLAESGLKRLGLADRISQILPKEMILPAVGQGALGLETRAEDRATIALLAALDHADTHAAVLAERAMLATLRGGCLAPVGGWARITSDGLLHLSGVVLSADGKQRLFAEAMQPPGAAEALGVLVAETLLRDGAAELIQASRSSG
ncbi:MAG: hydroxymethylbilane synthase [Pirellulales bacterium]